MKGKCKRILSTILALVMVLALLPATALAALQHTVNWDDTGYIRFVIENGTWTGLSFSSTSDGEINSTKTVVEFPTYKATNKTNIGYVYKCGSSIEDMLIAILSGNPYNFIKPADGYYAPALAQQSWTVNATTGGGLTNSALNAKEQMQLIGRITYKNGEKHSAVHDYDSTSPINGFGRYTVYTLTLPPIEYTVKYDLNGGSGNIKDDTTYYHSNYANKTTDASSTITVTDQVPTRDGYVFDGWELVGSTGTVGDTISVDTYWDNTSVVGTVTDGTGVFTLKAKWIEKYNVTYDPNGGTLTIDRTSYTSSNPYVVSVKKGATHNVISTEPIRTNYTFLGWYAGETKYEANAAITSATTLTATWEENKVTINYKATTGGSVSKPSETVGVVTGNPEGSTASVTDDNYYFAGWYNGSTLVGTNPTYVPTSKVAATYTAKFERRGTITVNVENETVTYNGEQQTSIKQPTVSGLPTGYTYTVTGYTAATGTNANTDGYLGSFAADKSITITETATGADVTARFKVIAWNVGKLIITPKELTVTVTFTDKEYDSSTSVNVAKVEITGGKIDDDDVSIANAPTTGTVASADVGTNKTVTIATNPTLSGGDAGNYTLKVTLGKVNITASDDLKVSAADVTATYDGAEHPVVPTATVNGVANSDATITVVYSQNGTAIEGNPVNAGTYTASITAKLANYVTATANATVTISKRDITITADSAEQVYNSKALEKNSYQTTGGTLAAGQTISVTITGSQTQIGVSANTVSSVVIKDASGKVVTSNYNVKKVDGKLTVRPANVSVVKTPDQESGIADYDTVTWTITVTNNETEARAIALSLEDSIDGVTITNADGVDPADFSLDAGASVTFTASYKLTREDLKDDGSGVINTVTVYQKDDPENPTKIDEDTADSAIEVIQPFTDLSVSKDRTTNASITVGGTIKWTITITNDGNVDAIVTVEDALEGAVLTLNGETITADTELTVPAGGKIVIEASYKTTSSDAGKTIVNTVTVKDSDEEEYTATDDGTKINYPYIPPVVNDPTIKVKGLNTVDHVAYIIGVGNDEVNPLGTITRAEIANIYFRLMTDEFRSANWGTDNRFKDVPDDAWYTMAVLTLDKAGIITDSDDGSFRPNDPITRAELAVMAAQFCTVTGKIPATSFKDVPSTHWAAKEIALIEYAGWIEGYAGYFRPDDNLTRAEAVTIVNRMLQRGAEEENMLPDMVTFVDNADPDMWYYEAIQEAANAHDYTRTTKLLTGETFRGEKWTALLEATDWAALEQAWIAANSK